MLPNWMAIYQNEWITFKLNGSPNWTWCIVSNRPLPSCHFPLFQNEFWCATFHMEMSFSCTFIVLEIEFISIWRAVHQDSFWNRGKREIGNGLLNSLQLNGPPRNGPWTSLEAISKSLESTQPRSDVSRMRRPFYLLSFYNFLLLYIIPFRLEFPV